MKKKLKQNLHLLLEQNNFFLKEWYIFIQYTML